MEDTLAALHAAVIDAPADRTVRLVYADALDESGAPSDAARAEFIRAQVAVESMAEDAPERAALVARCRELFAENWIDWWRPVCAAMGLPEPHVPGRGLGQRVRRFLGRDKRPRGAPYEAHPLACTVSSDEHGFSAQFIAGFPELLYVPGMPPFPPVVEGGNLLGLWASEVPLARLRLGSFSEQCLFGLNGPALAKLTELILDGSDYGVSIYLARSPHLRGLKALKVTTRLPAEVSPLVHNPAWTELRSLTLTGITPPEAITALAEHCTLEALEELSFGISEVPELPAPAIGGPVGFMAAQLWQQVAATLPHPPGPIRWQDYWPALTALARSPVLPRLRRLRVTDADPLANTLTGLFRLLDDPDPDAILSDECVLAVADALDRDKLERLELPAARLTPACREELTRRFGARAALA